MEQTIFAGVCERRVGARRGNGRQIMSKTVMARALTGAAALMLVMAGSWALQRSRPEMADLV